MSAFSWEVVKDHWPAFVELVREVAGADYQATLPLASTSAYYGFAVMLGKWSTGPHGREIIELARAEKSAARRAEELWHMTGMNELLGSAIDFEKAPPEALHKLLRYIAFFTTVALEGK